MCRWPKRYLSVSPIRSTSTGSTSSCVGDNADHSLGSLDKLAQVTLRCISRGSSLFDSYVAPISLLNFLCAGAATAMGEAAQMRFRRTEQLHEQFAEL